MDCNCGNYEMDLAGYALAVAGRKIKWIFWDATGTTKPHLASPTKYTLEDSIQKKEALIVDQGNSHFVA